ncbi:TPA: hypothetical protein I8438_001510 [Serratia marcescens]|uniref:Uncharacterized protein n=1 Tax=Serratia marcescens TaxID=615 RepID=A0AB33FVI2_SERMA|nr:MULTISPECIES: hypothetical protein [Serratia]AKL43311.1 hypothetical protein AB188_23485 [Serratia marcescens]AWL70662.1 hypothetical protein DKC05_24935 [Serratia marcescens]MCX2172108.1 hypothetical protein [Serratia marcescens]MCX2178020.1 hypothetical protein [Serratia marcescens]MDP8603938.1 hypothetical protein [Serratia marcescens]
MSTPIITDTSPTLPALVEQMRALYSEHYRQYCDLQELGRTLGVVPVSEPIPEQLPAEATALIPAFVEVASRLDTLARMNRDLQSAIQAVF